LQKHSKSRTFLGWFIPLKVNTYFVSVSYLEWTCLGGSEAKIIFFSITNKSHFEKPFLTKKSGMPKNIPLYHLEVIQSEGPRIPNYQALLLFKII
jgi:hypothetical protein